MKYALAMIALFIASPALAGEYRANMTWEHFEAVVKWIDRGSV